MDGTVLAVGNNYFYVCKDIQRYKQSSIIILIHPYSGSALSNADTSEMDLSDSCCLVLWSPTGTQSLPRSCNVLTAWWRLQIQATPNGFHGTWGCLKHSTDLYYMYINCRVLFCKKEVVTYQQLYVHPLLTSLGEGFLGSLGGIFLQHLTLALGQDLQSKSNTWT